MLGEVLAGRLSRPNAKEVFAEHVATGAPVAAIIEARGFRQISDAGALGAPVDEVLAANPAAVADYRAGKAQAVGFLVGQVMKATRGQANAAMVQAALRERLEAPAEGEADGWARSNSRSWLGGVVLIAIGYARARGPWRRYQALKAQDANVARYEAWRGGPVPRREDRGLGGDGRPPPAGPDVGRDRGRRRRARVPRVLPRCGLTAVIARRPAATAASPPRATRSGRSSTEQRSITTSSPPSWAIRAASQLTTPSCSQRQRAPAATASAACGGHSSERRKTSTMSNGPVAATASASVG